jgi:hypothetical protein
MITKQEQMEQYMTEVTQKVEQYENPKLIGKIIQNLSGSYDSGKKAELIVKETVKYIVLLDNYIEDKEKVNMTAARNQRKELIKLLEAVTKETFTTMEENLIVPYWIYEDKITRRIKGKSKFSDEEIKEFLLRRSEDSNLYSALASQCYQIPPQVSSALHISQAIEDINDCIEDYEDDMKKGQPNIFKLYFLNREIPTSSWPTLWSDARQLSKDSGITDSVLKLGESVHMEGTLAIKQYDLPMLSEKLDEELKILRRDLLRRS